MEEQEDLLDLEEDTEVDSLPESTVFEAPRPKSPWKLFAVAVAVIIIAVLIIVKIVGNNSDNSVRIDLDAPVVEEKTTNPDSLIVPDKKTEVKETVKQEIKEPETKAEQKVVENTGTPVRVIQDRRDDVVFDANKATTKKPAQPAKKAVAKQPVVQKHASAGSWYVQFSSHSTRALAEKSESILRRNHQNLFADKQFVILPAVVKGQNTYRLRVPFHTSQEANGFCRNAKSDGLDCYIAK